MAKRRRANRAKLPKVKHFRHPEAERPMRPDVGTQAWFKKKKPPRTYRYDSSLVPALDWDGQNPAREQGEVLIAELGRRLEQIHEALAADPDNEALRTASAESLELLRKLKALGRPFLNWAGKARFSERKGTPLFGSCLPEDKAIDLIRHLADRNGVRATARLVGVHRDTVVRYSRLLGAHAQELHDELVAFSPSD